jgi:hypothetical protein
MLSPVWEKVHPIESGFFRRRHRSERRPGLPRESVFLFWLHYLAENAGKFGAMVRIVGWLTWTAWRVSRDPNAKAYTDQALAPVVDDDETSLEMLTKTAGARAAISHQKKVARLTHAAHA